LFNDNFILLLDCQASISPFSYWRPKWFHFGVSGYYWLPCRTRWRRGKKVFFYISYYTEIQNIIFPDPTWENKLMRAKMKSKSILCYFQTCKDWKIKKSNLLSAVLNALLKTRELVKLQSKHYSFAFILWKVCCISDMFLWNHNYNTG